MVFRRMLVPIILLGIAAPVVAAQQLGEVAPQRAPEQVYGAVCGYCHGRNVGPVLLGRHLPAETIKYVARHGQNGMPAFRPTEVSPAELEQLAEWISKAAPRPQDHGQ